MPVRKKRLIAIVRCEGGQSNAANAHGSCGDEDQARGGGGDMKDRCTRFR